MPQNLGVNIDELLLSQPDTGEQALEIAEALVRSGAVDIIVVDSVAALVPKAEIEGEMGDSYVGLQARLMSQAHAQIVGCHQQIQGIAIFINQIREKVGVMFGNPETTPGGRALKFYSSIRLEVRRAETIKQGNEMVGNRTKIKVVKNKVAPPFRQAEVDIMYGEGISREGSIIDIATEMDIIQKSGAWYSYNGERLGQGRENVKQYLKEHPEVADEIERHIRELCQITPPRMVTAATDMAELYPEEYSVVEQDVPFPVLRISWPMPWHRPFDFWRPAGAPPANCSGIYEGAVIPRPSFNKC